MIIVRTSAGKDVEGWRIGRPNVVDRPPVLLQPDGAVCGAEDFLFQGMRATATTAAERTALERGGYLSRLRGRGARSR